MGESYYNQKKSFKLFRALIKSEFPHIYNFQAILCKIVNYNFLNILKNSMDYLNIIDDIYDRKGKQNNKELTQEWETYQNPIYLNL